ncbi:carboxymuconolactone decarboxylase family protein [Mycobacterium sp. 852002-51057_SCH5723018]|uniref:carboxymuconolactone decarboxylase family protein n=1 Tax=Mycobacterium sp. 852002-51057_SCH5723018 TaxID=1834094 RepID=UPI0007FE8412|nr:carboxymuconolactone decarboxylase family protein [Mycobacterium sp. 852002-51057_SCH5723018]OBG28586.1 carboxymuconolactone decarboxylase [Mycobacterium sp. 852002-51057_SCH5723018]
MSVDDLGGRLPLYDGEALNPAQKELYDWLMTVAVPWAEDAKFEARTENGRLIGPFNAALLNPAISSALMELAVAEQTNTSLSKRSREVIILTVGAVWRAPYELYAHSAVARHVGLSDDAVQTLAEGGLPKDLTAAEAIVHRVARALSLEHCLDEALYREAEALLGAEGIMETAILTGMYHTVCAILNAFEIPAPPS